MNKYLDEILNSLLESYINGENMTPEENNLLHEHALMAFNGIRYRYVNMDILYEEDAIVCEIINQHKYAKMIREINQERTHPTTT